jgi:hypothetical protein
VAGDFLTFRLMITPLMIQIVFWLGVLVCFGLGGYTIARSFVAPVRSNYDSRDDQYTSDRTALDENGDRKMKTSPTTQFSETLFALGAAILVLGPFLLRLFCELLIVIFKIHEELRLSNDRQRYRT